MTQKEFKDVCYLKAAIGKLQLVKFVSQSTGCGLYIAKKICDVAYSYQSSNVNVGKNVLDELKKIKTLSDSDSRFSGERMLWSSTKLALRKFKYNPMEH